MKKSRITAVSAVFCIALGLFSCSDKNESSQSSAPEIPTNAVSAQPVADEVVEPFVNYFKGYAENDAELAFRSTTPDCYIEALKETNNYEPSIADLSEQIAKNAQMWEETFGANVTATYDGEISNTPLTDKQLELAQRCIEYYYYGIEPRIDVTEGYEVIFKYTIKGDSNSTTSEETACFVKIGSQWVMIPNTASYLNSYAQARDPYAESDAE